MGLKEYLEKKGEYSGILLLVCTVISILLANFAFGESYVDFWHTSIGFLSLENWINDGLMAIFFFLVGLELKRELLIGELSSFRKGILPVFAAFGGMIVPAGIYMLFNYGTSTQHGFGIPMATDIAFAIGILSLLGKRVPIALKVLLTAIAVIDDFGAILVIAVFYSSNLHWLSLLIVAVIFLFLLFLNKRRIHSLPVYIIGGAIMWYFMMKSGVHATVAGILLSITIPFDGGDRKGMSIRMEHRLNVPVNFIILPVFALANTAIIFEPGWNTGLGADSSLGIILGLFIGKPIGILLLSFIIIKLGVGELPGRLRWSELLGAGMLAGIGFTMSIFISLLAFNSNADAHFLITEAKISILAGSLISGIAGTFYLKWLYRKGSVVHLQNDSD